MNNNKIKTLKDSELDQEELIINDSFDENNNINNYNNMNNNFIKGNFREMNDYKIIYDKEITNKIKYELEQDLINKQKQNWSKRMLSDNKKNKNKGRNDILYLNKNSIRTKLALYDLEKEKNNNIKEIENLIKDGINDNKLNLLEKHKKKYHKNY